MLHILRRNVHVVFQNHPLTPVVVTMTLMISYVTTSNIWDNCQQSCSQRDCFQSGVQSEESFVIEKQRLDTEWDCSTVVYILEEYRKHVVYVCKY